MKNKSINEVGVPAEVQIVWTIQHAYKNYGTCVGSDLYNRCVGIIKKYPEWFPEENKALDKIKKQQK